MQQLLGDKASSTNGSFLREPFLQQLPTNIHMILASTVCPEELAQLSDKIVDLAAPSVAAISIYQSFQT